VQLVLKFTEICYYSSYFDKQNKFKNKIAEFKWPLILHNIYSKWTKLISYLIIFPLKM